MFESAKLKVERAKHHISNLQTVFDAFIVKNPYTLTISNDTNSGDTTIDVSLNEPLPPVLALIIGDAVHNLRTALDHATWELIGRDRGTQDRYLKLPTGDNRVNYEACCKGIKTPRADTKAFFIALGIYEGGPSERLYTLNSLDTVDKHTVLTPIAGITSIPLMRVIRSDGVEVATFEDCGFGMTPDGRVTIMRLGIGLRPEFNEEAKPTIGIIFGDIDGFKFEPVIPTLVHLADAVMDTIGQFENFVSSRM